MTLLYSLLILLLIAGIAWRIKQNQPARYERPLGYEGYTELFIITFWRNGEPFFAVTGGKDTVLIKKKKTSVPAQATRYNFPSGKNTYDKLLNFSPKPTEIFIETEGLQKIEECQGAIGKAVYRLHYTNVNKNRDLEPSEVFKYCVTDQVKEIPWII